MTVSLKDFLVVGPSTLTEALKVLAAASEPVTPVAGGTDLMVYLETGDLPPGLYLNLRSIRDLPPALSFEDDGAVGIGPLCTFLTVRRCRKLAATHPMLAAAAREVGALAIQSRGTWVGNVANASPAADGVPALMAYDAHVELSGGNGTRQIPLARFYLDYKQTARRADELVTRLWLPSRKPEYTYYRKVGTRRFQAISKTLLAATLQMASGGVVDDVRLCLASVAPIPLRARRTEARLRGRRLEDRSMADAVSCLKKEIRPIDDVRSTRVYRRHVSGNLLVDFLKDVRSRSQSPV